MNEQDQPSGRPMQALIGRDRIRGASRMIAEGTEARDVTAEQIQQVGADLETFLRSAKISRKDVAKAVGYSPGVISEFIRGTYAGNQAEVAIHLENWLVEEEQRRQRPRTTQFTWTNVALQIKAVANCCLDYRNIGLVYGPDTAGIGKTTALQAIHQEIGPRRSSLVTVDKVDANPTGLMVKICQAMHVADHGSNRNKFKRMVDYLRGRSHLLLIDQIHNLRHSKDDKPFYILTDLHDATNTAQLWCGTADLVSYLNKQRRKVGDESLAQVRSRIYPSVDLMEMLKSDGGGGLMVTIQQVHEMFARNKLRLTGAGERWFMRLCNTPDSGGVRTCKKIMEYAMMLADMRGLASIDVPLLAEALRCGVTHQRADLLIQEIEQEPKRLVAALG